MHVSTFPVLKLRGEIMEGVAEVLLLGGANQETPWCSAMRCTNGNLSVRLATTIDIVHSSTDRWPSIDMKHFVTHLLLARRRVDMAYYAVV